MTTSIQCPICRVCGAGGARFLCTTDNEHSRTTVIEHYACVACGSVFVANALGNDELGQAYASIDASEYYKDIEVESSRKMRTAIADLRALEPSTTCRLIDIGTGNGSFIRMLSEAGYTHLSAHEIEGTDLSAIQNIVQGLYLDHDYRSMPEGIFDVATLLDVVEHVPDPSHLLRMCHRTLRNGGIIYFHTPVVTRTDRLMHVLLRVPLLRKLARAWQRGRTSVFHLENYTRRSLTGLLEQAGFTDIRIVVKNELSWPVSKYVQVYLSEKCGMPSFLVPILTAVLYPILATNLFNANKAIVSASKRTAPGTLGAGRE